MTKRKPEKKDRQFQGERDQDPDQKAGTERDQFEGEKKRGKTHMRWALYRKKRWPFHSLSKGGGPTSPSFEIGKRDNRCKKKEKGDQGAI